MIKWLEIECHKINKHESKHYEYDPPSELNVSLQSDTLIS